MDRKNNQTRAEVPKKTTIYKWRQGGKISTKEMEMAIKKLKRNKSVGPDKIPNEIFIEANKETKQLLKTKIENIHATEDIPQSWEEGEMIRLYKGKGQKGKCSNERGITLASNVGKVYKRNNRSQSPRHRQVANQDAPQLTSWLSSSKRSKKYEKKGILHA